MWVWQFPPQRSRSRRACRISSQRLRSRSNFHNSLTSGTKLKVGTHVLYICNKTRCYLRLKITDTTHNETGRAFLGFWYTAQFLKLCWGDSIRVMFRHTSSMEYTFFLLRGLSPQANCTYRATAACRQSYCQLFSGRGCHVVGVTHPYDRNLDCLDRSRYFFSLVAPQLYS
jgi:hypothetical protein